MDTLASNRSADEISASGLDKLTDGPRRITRRDLRNIRASRTLLGWAWLTLRLRLRGAL